MLTNTDRVVNAINSSTDKLRKQGFQRRMAVTDLYGIEASKIMTAEKPIEFSVPISYDLDRFARWWFKIEVSEYVDANGKSPNYAQGGEGGVLGDDRYPNDTEDHKLRNLVIAIRRNWPNATANGIAAVAGNFHVESTITPKRYEADFLDDSKYDQMEKTGTIESCWGSWAAFPGLRGVSLNEAAYRGSDGHYCGIGLGQWTGPRGEALFKYAKSNKKSLWATSTQIAFAKTESKGGYFGSIVTSGGEPGNLAYAFLANWEGIINGTQGQRMAKARELASRIATIIKEEQKNDEKEEDKDKTEEEKKKAEKKREAAKKTATKTASVLKALAGKLGQTLGNGQCYGLVSWYSITLGGPGLGAGFSLSDAIGDTYNAANIGGGYNWARHGWKVAVPSKPEHLIPGSIVTIKANFGGVFQTGSAGHVAVVENVGGGRISILEQNYGGHQFVERHNYDINQYLAGVNNVIYPPEIVEGKRVDPNQSTNELSEDEKVQSFATDWKIEMDGIDLTPMFKKQFDGNFIDGFAIFPNEHANEGYDVMMAAAGMSDAERKTIFAPGEHKVEISASMTCFVTLKLYLKYNHLT